MRQKYVDWQRQVEESGLDPTWATLLRLAVDGLWFAEMHHYAPPNAERREQIADPILQLTTGPVPIHG